MAKKPHSGILVLKRPPRPLMIYDGDCGFCRKWINRWKFLTGEKTEYEPYQKMAKHFSEITLEEFKKSVQLIEPDGKVYQGAEAVFKSLLSVPFLGWLFWLYSRVPGFSFLSERVYAFVAGHRNLFSSVDSCGLSQADEKPAYFVSRWLFLKVMALVYLAAFGSLWFQVDGLIGEKGILPARFLIQAAQGQMGPERFWLYPTLCWINCSNGFLHFLCGAGVVLALFLFLNLFPSLVCFLLWLFYLSLVTVGQDFLSFQWDMLLLEAGFLSIFLMPLRFPWGSLYQPLLPGRVTWLFRWLLFRLIFCSGVVKLASGDPTWHNLTALHYHYETQPLPTPAAWFMNQLPDGFQMASCLFMFFVELVVPFFIFGPRRLRSAAFFLMAGFQLLILITGNYCFFNYLTIGLCLWVLEDQAWPRWLRERLKPPPQKTILPAGPWPPWVTAMVLTVVLFMNLLQIPQVFRMPFRWPYPLRVTYAWMESLRSVNTYGLFMVMTTNRPEIQVEGSDDGKTWLPYGFKWKAGDLKREPAMVAPHQPRLDWQMWFAALGNYRDEPWFVQFLIRLLQGSPDVLNLLKTNPFPDHPPRFVRAQAYDYHFTNFAERAETGDWWKREYKEAYIPAFSLKDVRGD